jgi:hypothetical protein
VILSNVRALSIFHQDICDLGRVSLKGSVQALKEIYSINPQFNVSEMIHRCKRKPVGVATDIVRAFHQEDVYRIRVDNIRCGVTGLMSEVIILYHSEDAIVLDVTKKAIEESSDNVSSVYYNSSLCQTFINFNDSESLRLQAVRLSKACEYLINHLNVL